MTMHELFDGSDAHLLPGNAELVERLNEPELHYPGNFDTPRRANALLSGLCQEAADALEAADKRIAEMEADLHNTHARVMQNGKAAQEAERKLAAARESMRNTYDMLLGEPHTALACMRAEDMLRGALAQIGVDE